MAEYQIRSDVTWDRTIHDLRVMFEKWDILEWKVERAAYVATSYKARGDRWARIDYVKDGVPVSLPMDDHDSPRLNLRVLYLTLEDMRMIERRGGGAVAQAAYVQLQAGGAAAERDPYEVLGLRRDATPEVVQASYKALAKKAHPDIGGDEAQMEELNHARERIEAERVAAP